MSKKDTQARPDKRSRRRAENRRQTIIWNVIVLGTLGLFVAIVAWYIVVNLRPGPLPGEMVIADEGYATVPEGVPLPAFGHEPPVSGTHYPRAADWGLSSTTPVTPGIYISNLQLGGVVFLYKCATPCPDLVQKFQVLYDKAPTDPSTGQRKILITPYDKDLPTPIVALAWDHQLNLPGFDEAKMLLWYKRFLNQGPGPG